LATPCEVRAKLDEAVAAYSQRRSNFRPDWAEAHGALGNALREQGNLEAAVEEFKKVVRLRPELAAGYLSLGKAFHIQGKRGKALAAYATAIPPQARLARCARQFGKRPLG
jgi:tetratricopeptide (TPR) repeat protein